MIEIIEEGTKSKIRCNFCGALLSYQKNDIEEGIRYRPIYGYKKFILCPQCSNEIILEDN